MVMGSLPPSRAVISAPNSASGSVTRAIGRRDRLASPVKVAVIGVVAIAVALHDALALGLGYGIARAFRLPLPMVKAMTFEVGIRNAGLGLLLVFAFFNGLGGMALVAAWWGIWDIIAALTLARIWRVRTRERDVAPAAAAAG